MDTFAYLLKNSLNVLHKKVPKFCQKYSSEKLAMTLFTKIERKLSWIYIIKNYTILYLQKLKENYHEFI